MHACGAMPSAWHNATNGVKDGGRQIQAWFRRRQHKQTNRDLQTVSPPTEMPSYGEEAIVLRRTVIRQPTLRSRCEPISGDQADAELRC